MRLPQLDVLQNYADGIAKEINAKHLPVLRWLNRTDDCSMAGLTDTHIHNIDVSGQKAGTICVNPLRLGNDKRGWRWAIAHETCHLNARNCDLPEFTELMRGLGF